MANFTVDNVKGCPGMTVQFTDQSTNAPTSWSWSFPGGIPSISTAQNPQVIYNFPGTYNNVKLVASNAGGSDSVIKYSYIAISPGAVATTNPSGNVLSCSSGQLITSNLGSSYKWLPTGQTNYFLNAVATGTYYVIVTDQFGCKDTSAPVSVLLSPLPTPTVTPYGDTLVSSPAYAYQWYDGNNGMIPGATTQTLIITQPGDYYVQVSDSNGCMKNSAVITTGVSDLYLDDNGLVLIPTISDGNFTTVFESSGSGSVQVTICDVAGKTVFEENLNLSSGKRTIPFRLRLEGGVYFLTVKEEQHTSTKKFIIQ